MYGLKQIHMEWYRNFYDFMLRIGFKRCNFDSCVYILKENDLVLTYKDFLDNSKHPDVKVHFITDELFKLDQDINRR